MPNIIASWSRELRDAVIFYPMNSMEYFDAQIRAGERSDLTFIDGNHDYEFALFDIASAARVAVPGGFIFIDNISQAGPFLAAQDFIRRHPEWTECGGNSLQLPITDSPFQRRSPIRETDFCVLRRPHVTNLTAVPYTSGQLRWVLPSFRGVHFDVISGPPGVLHIQWVIRTFAARVVSK